jgi:5-oxoprolinase (ATP-hydrolysing) subunit A
MTLAGSLCAEMARTAGLRIATEVFPDRAYLSTGHLAPRTMTGAVIHDLDKVKERVLKLASTGLLTSIDGVDIKVDAETLCIHGDTPGAWQIAKIIRETLEAADIRVVPIGNS